VNHNSAMIKIPCLSYITFHRHLADVHNCLPWGLSPTTYL